MKIQTEQNKPHRNQTSIAQEFIVSFTIIISGITIVYIENNLNVWGMNLNHPSGYDCISNSWSLNQYQSPKSTPRCPTNSNK